jgi:hypothetical protein
MPAEGEDVRGQMSDVSQSKNAPSGRALCDFPGCDKSWLFVQHVNKVPKRRRCQKHWFVVDEGCPPSSVPTGPGLKESVT